MMTYFSFQIFFPKIIQTFKLKFWKVHEAYFFSCIQMKRKKTQNDDMVNDEPFLINFEKN